MYYDKGKTLDFLHNKLDTHRIHTHKIKAKLIMAKPHSTENSSVRAKSFPQFNSAQQKKRQRRHGEWGVNRCHGSCFFLGSADRAEKDDKHSKPAEQTKADAHKIGQTNVNIFQNRLLNGPLCCLVRDLSRSVVYGDPYSGVGSAEHRD